VASVNDADAAVMVLNTRERVASVKVGQDRALHALPATGRDGLRHFFFFFLPPTMQQIDAKKKSGLSMLSRITKESYFFLRQ
jgi:hypothetical protein